MEVRLVRQRLHLAEVLYVLAVGALAVGGFAAGSTPLIVAAAVLAVPASIVALPAYYVAYGLVALVPGANPSQAGGTSCSDPSLCQTVTTGDLASWFNVATVVLGIALLTAASLANALLLRVVRTSRRSRSAVLPLRGVR